MKNKLIKFIKVQFIRISGPYQNEIEEMTININHIVNYKMLNDKKESNLTFVELSNGITGAIKMSTKELDKLLNTINLID